MPPKIDTGPSSPSNSWKLSLNVTFVKPVSEPPVQRLKFDITLLAADSLLKFGGSLVVFHKRSRGARVELYRIQLPRQKLIDGHPDSTNYRFSTQATVNLALGKQFVLEAIGVDSQGASVVAANIDYPESHVHA